MLFQTEKAFQMEETPGTKAWGRRAKQYGRIDWSVKSCIYGKKCPRGVRKCK